MKTALLVIDVQNDFTEGGALEVAGGSAIAAGITDYLARVQNPVSGEAARYAHIFGSRDWHDEDNDNGGHFSETPDYVDSWPVHCVAGTDGAEYHPDFDETTVTVHIRKGQGIPAYSIFEGTDEEGNTTLDLISRLGITAVDIVGLATDHCVRASALDALNEGLSVRVFTDLVAGVDQQASEAALAEITAAGSELAESHQ